METFTYFCIATFFGFMMLSIIFITVHLVAFTFDKYKIADKLMKIAVLNLAGAIIMASIFCITKIIYKLQNENQSSKFKNWRYL